MPQAVTHILVPILLVAIFRDFFYKGKKRFSLHYVLLAGLGGVLPDIDIIFSIILTFFGVENWNIHKTFTHSLFFPLIFFILFFVLKNTHEKAKICNIGRHKLELSKIFLVLGIGILIHIFLDALVGEIAFFFYPISMQDYSVSLMNYLPTSFRGFAMPLLDGVLLVIWIVYLELKHRISDFI